MKHVTCPLTPALLELVKIAAMLETTDAATLAEHLCKSKNTVRTEWQKIHALLEVKHNWNAVQLAIHNKWIDSPPAEKALRWVTHIYHDKVLYSKQLLNLMQMQYSYCLLLMVLLS